MEIEWINQTEFPGELNGTSGFSVDVLVYSKALNEHTIGFYDFKVMTWRFLLNEEFKSFKWRYFDDLIDKPLKLIVCKKIKHRTIKEAKKALKEWANSPGYLRGKKITKYPKQYYKCKNCGCYHITKKK